MNAKQLTVCALADMSDPGSKEFRLGEGDWPFRGFVVRRGEDVFAYQNFCMHVGHPLNWQPDSFLTPDGLQIICASHGAIYEIESGVCISGPCPGKILRSVPAEIQNGDVIVSVPAPA